MKKIELVCLIESIVRKQLNESTDYMAVGHTVKVTYKGHKLFNRIGIIVQNFGDDFVMVDFGNEKKKMNVSSLSDMSLKENIAKKQLNEIKDSDLFELNKDLIDDYQYQLGEKVTVQHETWKEPRIMVVMKDGKYPTFSLGSLDIEIMPSNKDKFVLIPEDLRNKLKHPERKKSSYVREKHMMKREYQKAVRDMIRGLEYEDHSVFYDQAENLYKTNAEVRYYIHFQYPYWSKGRAIEQICNDMEIYAK